MKEIILDTNAYTGYFNGDGRVLEAISLANRVYLSVFMLGELYFGFKNGSKEVENLRLLQAFITKSTVRILSASENTAEIFGLLKYTLKKQGTPIPLNDVWIAAHSLEKGAVLITHDVHFKQVPGIRTWEYV